MRAEAQNSGGKQNHRFAEECEPQTDSGPLRWAQSVPEHILAGLAGPRAPCDLVTAQTQDLLRHGHGLEDGDPRSWRAAGSPGF